jgi:hypothetical protein
MNNREEKASLTRRIIGIGLTTLLLIVFPAVSWVYLRSGLNWRKQAISELRGHYGNINDEAVRRSDPELLDSLKGKVCIVHSFGLAPDTSAINRHILQIGEKLYKQFGILGDGRKTKYFKLVMVAHAGSEPFYDHVRSLPTAANTKWGWSISVDAWGPFLDKRYGEFCGSTKENPVQETFALCDTTGAIRRFYNALDKEQVDRMVTHVTMLLPPNE